MNRGHFALISTGGAFLLKGSDLHCWLVWKPKGMIGQDSALATSLPHRTKNRSYHFGQSRQGRKYVGGVFYIFLEGEVLTFFWVPWGRGGGGGKETPPPPPPRGGKHRGQREGPPGGVKKSPQKGNAAKYTV